MAPSERRIRPAASNDLVVPSLCICLLFVSVPLLVSVILGLTIIILNAGSRRQWSAFLTTKKVLRYDACAVKSDFCSLEQASASIAPLSPGMHAHAIFSCQGDESFDMRPQAPKRITNPAVKIKRDSPREEI